MIQGRFC